MDDTGTPQDPGQTPPPDEPAPPPLGDPPAPEQDPQPPVDPGEPPATPPPPPPAQPGTPSPPPSPQAQEPPGAPFPPAQPQYQQPAAGQPIPSQTGQAPAKKKPVAIILVAIAAVLLLCGTLACGVGAFMLINAGPDFEETSTQADVHFDAAYYLIEDNIDGYYNEFEYVFEDAAAGENEDAASQYVDILDSANADIATARNELAQAEGLIATLDESEFKGRYLDAIALMYRSLDTYDQLYAGMPQKSGDMASVHILLENLQDADDELSESVRDVNKGDYAEAKAEANAALAIYQDAAAYFEDLAVRYPELEFDLQVTIEQEYVKAAIAAVKAAEAGLAGDNAAYQKHVAEYDAADAALESATSPFWIDDWGLLWEEEVLAWDEAWALAEESWEAREAAWLAADEGNY